MLKRTEEEKAKSRKRVSLLLIVVDGLLLAYLIFVLIQHLAG